MSSKKIRLDRLLVEKGLIQSRERARARIMSGEVLVDRFPVDKPGAQVSIDALITLRGEDIPYVSRGGLKLAAALQAIGLDLTNLDCMDVGASTGGFTDCLLQHGARRVVAVDVGYGQMAWKLRNDPRVRLFERTNIRHLEIGALDSLVDLITIDTSFISLKIVVPAAQKFLKRNGVILALIKPQFEAGRTQVGNNGVIRDPRVHDRIIHELSCHFKEIGLFPAQVVPSPILGPKGNREFMIFLKSER